MGKKKPKRTTQKNKADRLFSQYIRARDKVCQRCFSPNNLQAAHVFSRSYYPTRWDERNAIALCVGCHKHFTHRPIQWEDFIRKRMGEGLWWELRELAGSSSSAEKLDYDEVIAELERRLSLA